MPDQQAARTVARGIVARPGQYGFRDRAFRRGGYADEAVVVADDGFCRRVAVDISGSARGRNGTIATPVDGVGQPCAGCSKAHEAEQRPDDSPAAVEQRWALYEEQTAPLIAHYRRQGVLAVVDGVGSPDEVFGRLLAAIVATTGLSGPGGDGRASR